jgi:hypothetical protein
MGATQSEPVFDFSILTRNIIRNYCLIMMPPGLWNNISDNFDYYINSKNYQSIASRFSSADLDCMPQRVTVLAAKYNLIVKSLTAIMKLDQINPDPSNAVKSDTISNYRQYFNNVQPRTCFTYHLGNEYMCYLLAMESKDIDDHIGLIIEAKNIAYGLLGVDKPLITGYDNTTHKFIIGHRSREDRQMAILSNMFAGVIFGDSEIEYKNQTRMLDEI